MDIERMKRIENHIDQLLLDVLVREKMHVANCARGIHVFDAALADGIAVHVVVRNNAPRISARADTFAGIFAGVVKIVAVDRSFVGLSFMSMFRMRCEAVAHFADVVGTLADELAAIDAHLAEAPSHCAICLMPNAGHDDDACRQEYEA